jgi:heme/copper-type cytochrome/quinol oxidase subunit 2
MPIKFRVVSEDVYNAWLGEAKKKFAATDGSTKLASSN